MAPWRPVLDFYLSAYDFLLSTFGLEILSFLSRNSLSDPEFRKGRLGFYPNLPGRDGPRVWFHAVSVGEVTGAVPTLLAFRKKVPEAMVVLTTGTPQGLRFARTQLPPDVAVFPFPLDFSKSVARALSTLRPDLFVAFETEFWPNFYGQLSARGIPALLLNGRISESSGRLYRFLSPLFRPVFRQFERMAMHSEEDVLRALRIGAPAGKVQVLGSSKYDGLRTKARPENAAHWKNLLKIGEGVPVVLGGSLRESECIQLMQVFLRLQASRPNLLGIFAPRHMHNIPRMVEWLARKQAPYNLLTEVEAGSRPRTAPVVLVDRIGALFDLYSAGDLIFCGGTLVPVGGHNILEPAAWSRPVFYGPHLKKILHEHRILRGFGGSFPVSDADDLFRLWDRWLADLDGLREHGRRAREALESLAGVVDRQVDLIVELLERRLGESNSNAKA